MKTVVDAALVLCLVCIAIAALAIAYAMVHPDTGAAEVELPVVTQRLQSF